MISYPMAVGGLQTRVLKAGDHGPVIVFVHGTGGRADRWSRNLDAVAASGRQAYAFDLPGHGFASKGAGVACSVPAYRAFLGRFLDVIEAPRATLVGTSLGGHVVASYATQNPQRIDGIALVGSMGLVPIGDDARTRIQAGANNQTREGVAMKLQRVIHDPSLVTLEMQEEEWRINNSPGSRESFAALGSYIAADLDKEVVGESLVDAPFPVLLVWGDQDKTVPTDVGRKVRDLVPRSRLALLSGAAHTAYYERAEDFNRILIDFLDGKTGAHQSPHVAWS